MINYSPSLFNINELMNFIIEIKKSPAIGMRVLRMSMIC